MQVYYNKRFLKDLVKIPHPFRNRLEALVFQDIPKYNHYSEIQNIGKIKGFKSYYRIRQGDYRIGLKIVGSKIVFERVLHRKDIYKYFP